MSFIIKRCTYLRLHLYVQELSPFLAFELVYYYFTKVLVLMASATPNLRVPFQLQYSMVIRKLTLTTTTTTAVIIVITLAGIAAGVGMAFSRVCLFVRALKGKRLELSIPNLVHI